MTKQVLGRNLEALLDGGAKKADDPFAPETAPAGPGVRSLMRGHPTAPARQPEAAFTRKPMVPVWYLFEADILLAALALVVVCKSPHPLSWQKEVFCTAAIVLGGCLALGAVWMEEEEKAEG